MKNSSTALRYTLASYRLDQFWLPAAFWVLFLIIAWLTKNDSQIHNVIDAFLCGVLPLMSGILAAYAIIDDPALELQFSTPRPAWVMLGVRLGMILVVVTAAALAYQLAVAVMGIDPSPSATLAERQLHWLIPSLAMTGLGTVAALLLAQCTFGAVVIGLVWIFEVIAQGLFVSDDIARLFFLMIGAFAPDHPARIWTYLILSALAVLFLAISRVLLAKQERYI